MAELRTAVVGSFLTFLKANRTVGKRPKSWRQFAFSDRPIMAEENEDGLLTI
jgi:hypothetical protein